MTPPRIALFGGSGATGARVLHEAAERGWPVNALVRRPGSLARTTGEVTEIVGEFEDDRAVAAVVQGAEAGLVVIGPRPPYREVFCEHATRAVIAAQRAAGVQRLVCLTGALIGDYPANQGPVFRWCGRLAGRRMAESRADRVGQEEVVRASGLAWTLVKPPRLTGGGRTGRARKGQALRIGLLSSVSRGDLAGILLDLCDGPAAVGEAVFVKG